ncbi:ABC transporter permease [Ectobacillus ponti]|uniref:ABC transporter permease n=1 Tax=Ectobacillus ponti TaxID=2961894 RepID=A0AA41X9G6_9BACI|nr:ABC transporter permease [Ectobacillus ponti]MCP8969335.1 ABC transporter permease [Ectobacillus ponti]
MTFRQLACNNVLRNKRTYAAYFFSSALSVMIFFLYAVFIFHPGIAQGVTRELAKEAMKIAECVLFVFAFFFILYSVGAFLKSRKKEFGILVMHGMSQRQLNRLVLLENMLIGLTAIAVGIGLGLLLSKLFLLWGASILHMEELPFYLSWKPLLLTIGAFVPLFLIISLLTAFFVRSNNLLDLLQGDMKPKPEPKASILLSLLAAALLLGGYTLSFTTTDKNIAGRFVMVVPMIIAGTYFMFSQLSVFIIHLLKGRNSLFWRKTNILTLSDLAYRMKDNARMFFLVSIVSTVTFCAVGTFATSNVYREQFKENHPFAVSYTSKEGNMSEARHLTSIEAELKKEKLAYTKAAVPLISQTSKESGQEVVLVSQSSYNTLAKLLQHPAISLQGSQAMFVPATLDQRGKLPAGTRTVTFQESGLIMQTKGSTPFLIFSTQTIGTNLLVVSDEAYEQIPPLHPQTVTAYQVDDWQQTAKVGEGIFNEVQKHFQSMQKGEASGPAPFSFVSAGYFYDIIKQSNNVMFFVALLIGAVFFIAAGSFLYFRLYTDLNRDQRKYQAIAKLGLTEQELNRTVTIQMAVLFFLPIAVAMVHSVFAFTALQSMFQLSIARDTFIVLAIFLVLQAVYFLIIRSRYLLHLKKNLL